MSDEAKKPLGRILLQQRALSPAELDAALARGGPAGPLATRLTESGLVSEVAALKALSEQSGVPGIDLTQLCLKLADLEVLPREVAVRHKILPVLVRDDRVFVAMATPDNHKVIDEIEFVSGKHVHSYIALDGPLARVIQEAYDARERGEAFYVGPLCPPEVLRKLGLAAPAPAGAVQEHGAPRASDPRREDSLAEIFVPVKQQPAATPPSRSQYRRMPTEDREELIEELDVEPDESSMPTPVSHGKHARDARSGAVTATPAGYAPSLTPMYESTQPVAAHPGPSHTPDGGGSQPTPVPPTRRAATSTPTVPRDTSRDTAPPPPDYAEHARSLQEAAAALQAPAIPLVVDDAMRSAGVDEEMSYAGFGDASSAVVDVAGAMGQRADTRRCVLVVDEDAALRRELRLGLEARGYRVLEAATGLSALKFIKEQDPQAIVLSAMLPEVHGFDIARRIKGSERYGDLPIVMISSLQRGAAFGADVRTSYGVEAYLEKPFHVDDVTFALERGFAQSRRHTDADRIAAEAERLLTAGIEAYRSGDLELATTHLREGARVDPLAFRLHFHLGLLFGKKGQAYDAIQELETAVEINGTHFAALKNLAVLYQKAGFRGKAVDTWERALVQAPDEPTRESIREHLTRLSS
jgi:DNA-binding response OmpR family regulator